MLKSIHLIWTCEDYFHEDDRNYFRWRSFPKIDAYHRHIIEWFALHNDYIPDLLHFKNDWLHTISSANLIILLITEDFRPNTYFKLLKNFMEQSQNDSNELFSKIVTIFVDFFICDKVYLKQETLRDDHDIVSGIGVKSLVKLFGLDVILIYTAILLRKRLVFYDHCKESLLHFLSALIGLHSKQRDLLLSSFYPNIDPGCSLQCDTLKGKTFFIASLTNFNLQQQYDMFDIFVNLPAVEIVISPQSKSMFAMTKIHKDIATNIVRISENGSSPENISSQINKKTQELYETLKNFIPKDCSKLKKWMLNKHQISNELEEFYWNLALINNIA